MSNDAARHELDHVLALVQEQMAGIAEMQKQRAALTATATAAEGMIEVTVDAQAMVVRTAIDEAYFDDYDLADLGEHITAAAQAAARDVQRRGMELMQPLTERRGQIPSLADMVGGMPDLQGLIPGADRPHAAPPHTDDDQQGWEEQDSHPTVRRA